MGHPPEYNQEWNNEEANLQDARDDNANRKVDITPLRRRNYGRSFGAVACNGDQDGRDKGDGNM